jgi:hypothetical protein
MDTPLPKFFAALEKHSASQRFCEVARYLSVQLFQVGLQYRHLLSSVAENSLLHLYRHLEPSSIPDFALAPTPDYTLHLRMLLELIDNPHLLLSDLNYTCQLSLVLVAISTNCKSPRGCIELISAVSEARIPLSTTALLCSALDQVVVFLSAYTSEDDSISAQLRYPRPPFPLPNIQRLPNGSKIFHQSDINTFALRSAISLCNILEDLYQYYHCHSITVPIPMPCETPPVKYVIKSSVKAIHIFQGLRGSAWSLPSKAERAALRLLCRIASVGFPVSAEASESRDIHDIELVIQEVISEGSHSPKSYETSLAILSFLCTVWKSDDILISNRLSSAFLRSLRKFTPELSEMLLMWDGDCEQVLWLMRNSIEMEGCVWDEVISRVEFWTAKGHIRYLQKWLIVLRSLLLRQRSDSSAIELESALASRGSRSLEAWLEQIAALVSEADPDVLDEIMRIRCLLEGPSTVDDADIWKGAIPISTPMHSCH